MKAGGMKDYGCWIETRTKYFKIGENQDISTSKKEHVGKLSQDKDQGENKHQYRTILFPSLVWPAGLVHFV